MRKINTLSGYIHEYQKSMTTPEAFWEEVAETFFWRKQWDNVLNWDFNDPSVEWFPGAKLNITENIFESRLHTHGDHTALIWEPNNPNEEAKKYSYNELYSEVKKMANVLLDNGVQKGDPVVLYMPMIPEATIAMLACARIGAIHSVVFGGFSAQALSSRINDTEAKMLLTANGYYRGEKEINMKASVDEALEQSPTISSVIVADRLANKPDTSWTEGRDKWWDGELDRVNDQNIAQQMESEDPLFILYTSGSTGKPKGIVHTTGGYMVYSAFTYRNVFQIKQADVYFCTADIGWITGHSYLVYGPLLNGSTTVMYEGVPTYPDAGRLWDIIEKHQVNIFYTAPTAIRSLMAMGTEHVREKEMKSLRVLGTVGEPINAEAWHWYHTHVGKERCPIVDTWWQTETGGIMISPMAGVIPTKPTYATLPMPGINPVIIDEGGKELTEKGVEGNLCIKFPWPGMARTVWGDHDRYKETYFSQFPGSYFSGDSVRRDEDGYFRILGRVDDVLNVSGHRFGTAEIENAINTHPAINEAAVVGFKHDIKGEGIFAFVSCDADQVSPQLAKNVSGGVSKMIGPIARPDHIVFVRELPKTRSGKIMRRILRSIVEGERKEFGDTSTLLNPQSIDAIINAVDNR
ncbi:acetate--CoA ligase [Vibrio sp. SS-MA-C1-2]|uniref:acetate--CoA ligase n=1 Tax=Vibrio sp. SS-MA-C1-2 TaxID=2908646 RepID=UPI001F288695|nr:acetate--CoA ligase [Vibrio sp. SS-MA-C1-2]UJF17111.1 acetate--CoA ligase [Vibrio sp. SS-MA-C1-2]